MKRNIQVQDQERSFAPEELFFSTTEKRGIITACNEVFLRVAQYEPAEILAQPHNIVRHPDMPRCVFKLLWDYLLSGRAIGAYVKNRAKHGEYYWVFALAMPIEEGFLSIRLKPTSPVFTTVQGLYPVLLKHEQSFGDDWRAAMQSSTEVLLNELRKLGFETYDQFMSEALRIELASRYELIKHSNAGTKSNAVKKAFFDLAEIKRLQAVLDSCDQRFADFANTLARSALNLGVRASHLGDRGRAQGVICKEVSQISMAVRREIAQLTERREALVKEMEQACFQISFAALIIEMRDYFEQEKATLKLSPVDQAQRFGTPFEQLDQILGTALKHSLNSSAGSRARLLSVLSSFENFIEALGKVILSIQFSYVTGKSLAATVSGSESFSVLLSDIIVIAEEARNEVNRIALQSSTLGKRVSEWSFEQRA